MREILESCVHIDTLAHRAYREMASRCTDPDTARLAEQMAVEERAHVQWWTELLKAWDAGLLPDIWADSDEVLGNIRGIVDQLESAVPPGEGPLTADEVLSAATRFEFFTLDPIFGELIDLTEPAVARGRHESYNHHTERLTAAVEARYPEGSLPAFLAAVLRRTQRENRRLARYASRDTLTGLSNRRAFNAQLMQWAAWAARYGHPLTVIFADVDDFKAINDRWGHSSGDVVLRLVADRIRSVVRDSDLPCRLGGDEFAILAPEIGLDGARSLSARLVEAVREIRAPSNDGEDIRTSVSVGAVVVLDDPDSQPRSLDDVMTAADQSLYAAKNAGRDRAADPVVLAGVRV